MHSRIGFKLIVVVGLVIMATLAVFSYLITRRQQQDLLAQVEQANHQLSETIKASTKYYMLNNDRTDLYRVITSIAGQQGIERIRIFNKEGEIKFSSQKDEMGKMVDKDAESCYACHAAYKPLEHLDSNQRTRIFLNKQGVRNLGIINPIYNEPSCSTAECHEHLESQKVLGVLDITMPLDEVDQNLQSSQQRVAVLAVTMIALVALILWFYVERFVSDPVHDLVVATSKVAQGDLSHSIEVSSPRDEIGNLAISFNEMIRKLNDANRLILQQDKLASLGRLSAGVAHELNNPLTGVLTFASCLLKQKFEDPQVKSDLEVIVRETKRCRDIVKSLLDFARQTPSQKTSLDINDAVRQALKLLENELALSKVTLIQQLDGGLPPITADRGQMVQVVINLVVNAKDACPGEGSKITVSTSAGEHKGARMLKMTVSDNGCGIPDKALSKIFEPFFSTKGQEGTGLGLSVVWGIIENHSGQITVDSKVGEGTTFNCYLPLA